MAGTSKKDLSILIKAKLDTSEQQSALMQKQLDKISKKLVLNISNIKLANDTMNKAIQKGASASEKAMGRMANSGAKVQIFDPKKLEEQGRKFFTSATNIVSRVKKEYGSMGDVNVDLFKNSKKQVTGFGVEIKKANGVVEKLQFSMAKLKFGNGLQKGFVYTGGILGDKNAGDNIQQALDKLQLYNNKVEKMKANFSSPKTGIQNTDNLAQLEIKYKNIKTLLDGIKNSNSNLSKEQRRDIIQQIADLDLEIKKYRDLETVKKSASKDMSDEDRSGYIQMQHNAVAKLQVGKSKVFENEDVQKELATLTTMLSTFGQKGAVTTKQIAVQFDNLSTKVRQVSNTFKNTSHDGYGFIQMLEIAGKKIAIWGISTGIVYGTFRQIKDGIKYIYEMDTAITDLSKVVNFSNTELKQMTESAIKMGKELGKSSVEIAKGMAEFGRIKKTQEEIIQLTKVAVMASNVTSMSAQDSAKALTTAMITFGIETKGAMHILDSFNEIQNNFRTSAEDLAEGIGKVGSASKIAKTDMETLEGLLTSIVSTTGVEGNEAGTA